MRHSFFAVVALAGSALSVAGCEQRTGADDYEATVDAFNGQLVHQGKPVSFEPDDEVKLQLVWQQKGENFGVPIKPDGTFTIGWMPLGEYSAVLHRRSAPAEGKRGSGAPTNYTVPGGLTIEEGKTDYQVELGEKWKK